MAQVRPVDLQPPINNLPIQIDPEGFANQPVKGYDEKIEPEESGACPFVRIFTTRIRFFFMIYMMLCLTITWSNILTYNLAVVCINDQAERIENETEHDDDEEKPFSISNGEKTWGIVTVAIAALLALYPVMYLMHRFGMRYVFALLGVSSSIATIIIPPLLKWGYAPFIVARAVQGIAFASNYPVIGAFCSRWAYYKQNGMFVSFLVAFIQLGPTITDPVSGALCDNVSWQSIFYIHGGVSLGLFVIFFIIYRDEPGAHPVLTEGEVEKIGRGKSSVMPPTPFMAILKTPSIWATWIAGLGNFTAVCVLFLYTPTYLNKALGFTVAETGLNSALAPSMQFLVKLIAGSVSDRIHFIPEVWKFRIFNTFAFGASAALFIVLGFMDNSNKNVNMIILSVAGGIIGSATGGFFKSAQVLSKQFSPFVVGNITVCLNVMMVIVPFVIDAITKENTQKEWGTVFFIVAGALIVSDIIYVIFVRGEPQWWTDVDLLRQRGLFAEAEAVKASIEEAEAEFSRRASMRSRMSRSTY